MNVRKLQHTALGLSLLGATVLVAHTSLPAAHAAGSTPSITASADGATYGVLAVAGVNFSGHDVLHIQVLDAPAGAWRTVATVTTGSSGGFTKIFSFAVSCTVRASSQVSVRAVDMTTNEASN